MQKITKFMTIRIKSKNFGFSFFAIFQRPVKKEEPIDEMEMEQQQQLNGNAPNLNTAADNNQPILAREEGRMGNKNLF